MVDPQIVKEWLNKADEDLHFSISIIEDSIFYAQICFHFHQAAEKHLKNVIAIEPFHYRAALNLAKIQIKLKRAPDSTAKLWRKIAKINPTHPDAKMFLKQPLTKKQKSPEEREIIESKKLKNEFDKIKQKVEITPDSTPPKKPRTKSNSEPKPKPKIKSNQTETSKKNINTKTRHI